MFILDVGVCNDPAILPFLSMVRRIISVIQIIVPFALIIWGTIGVSSLVLNPDEKQGIKKIINKFIAAVVVFIIPILVDAVMGLTSQSISSDTGVGSFSSCWGAADDYNSFDSNGYVE